MDNIEKRTGFYAAHKLNIDLYNSANEWIDFKEGKEIFGINTGALASRTRRANLPHQVGEVITEVEKYYFRKLDYLKLFFLDENEVVEHFKMSLQKIDNLAIKGKINTIKINEDIYYHYKIDSIEKRKGFYTTHKFSIDLYNSANEWIDFKEGKEIFGINTGALTSRVKRANLTIQVGKIIKKVEKYYFRKLDYLKLFFLDENEVVKHFKMPLQIIKNLVNEGSINTIKVDEDIYYHYKFNEEFNSKYTTNEASLKKNNAITIEEAYKFRPNEFDKYDDFVFYVFANRDEFKLKFVYEINTWFLSNSIIRENNKIKGIYVVHFYTTHKLNIDSYNSANEWINFKEGEEIFGINADALTSRAKRFNLALQVKTNKKNVKKYYFRKLDYIKLFFVDENEAAEHFKMPLQIIKEWTNEGIINTIKIDGDICYSRGFNEKYNSKYSAIKSYIKQNNAITIEEAYKFRSNEFDKYDDFVFYVFANRDKFKLKFVYILNTWFVSNSITGIIKKRERLDTTDQRLYHKKIEEAYPYVNELFDSYEDFKKEILGYKDKYNVKLIDKEYYVDLSKFFLKPKDAAKKLNMVYSFFLKLVKEGFIEAIPISTRYCLVKSIKDKTYKDYFEFKADQNNTLPLLPREMFKSDSHMIDYYLKWINDRIKFKESLKWIGYSIHNFSENSQATRSKFDKLKSFFLTAVRILQNLKKEIYDYNNEEINELYNSVLKNQDDIIRMKTILGYIMHNKLDCSFSDLPKEYRKKKKDKGLSDRFSPEIVERYFHYLSDLDRHFLKAVNNYRYAQLWLISMIHFSLARRVGDMVDLPKPDIELVNIYNFDDLFDRDITMSDMQIIIDNIKAKSYGEIASKNGWDLAFVRDLDLITQTGIAFTICELHRRKKGEKVLNFSFKNTNPNINDWRGFFDDELLKGFGNLKAVRSFLIDIYKYTSNVPDLRVLSYSIVTKFRAHKTNGIDESEVTKEYLEITKVDGFQDKIIYNVQRIGAFGFLYNLLTNLAYDTSESSLQDQVSYLENLKENLSKKSIENLSSFLSDTTENLNKIPKRIMTLSEKARTLLENKFMEDMKCYNEYKISEQIALAKEVIKLSKEEIRNKFEDIFKNLLDSKQPYCYCFKGFKNCKKRSSSPSVCIICKYSIPTVYTLSSLKNDINNLFEKIKAIPLDNRKMLFKYKILLLKYTGVISEVHNEFAKYDNEFINSFINLSEFKKQVIEIEKSVFNKAGGLR